MNSLYDQIMSVLHDAGAFAKSEHNEQLAQTVQRARQIAETELHGMTNLSGPRSG